MKRVALGAVLAVLLASAAQAEQQNCTVEETNLQMVERDRKADERKIAALGVRAEQDQRRIAALEAQVKALAEQLAKAEQNAAPAAP